MVTLQWLKPQLVAQVSFTEMDELRLLRHAKFFGLRRTKDAREVVKE
jgi:bifunctional non-homologous end joining protein LigD